MPRSPRASRDRSRSASSPAPDSSAPPRYARARAFPPYAYITGFFPHPRRDPRGHSFGVPEVAPLPIDPKQPLLSEDFLYGIDLFNHGYYWEAHEAWEGLWRVSREVDRALRVERRDRSGTNEETGVTTLFLQALIKLAAAGFKVRQGRPEGVRRHASRAAELLLAVEESRAPFRRSGRVSKSADRYCGLSIAALIALARRLGETPPEGAMTAGERAAPIALLQLRIESE